MTMNDKDGIGGSPQHDVRREGTVTPRSHNLQRSGGTTNATQAKLEDPNLPHQEKSGRELRREQERLTRQVDDGQQSED